MISLTNIGFQKKKIGGKCNIFNKFSIKKK
jgi:hypothetical protein